MSIAVSVQAISAGTARRAIWHLLVAEVLIGSVGVFVHESGQDPVAAAFYRCLFGALFLTACGLIGGQLRDAVVSGVLLVLHWVALSAGMARSSIGVATIVYPVFPHCCGLGFPAAPRCIRACTGSGWWGWA